MSAHVSPDPLPRLRPPGLRRPHRGGDPPLPAPGGRRLALVYRGPAARPAGCSEAVAALLEAGPWDLDVRYTGPSEDVPLSLTSLAHAHLYAQPGGGSLGPALPPAAQAR
ncbi:hypothetical protein O1L55_21920 [Streptomyces albulus]|nr:hypothetical protein [Streptomyces noursei]